MAPRQTHRRGTAGEPALEVPIFVVAPVPAAVELPIVTTEVPVLVPAWLPILTAVLASVAAPPVIDPMVTAVELVAGAALEIVPMIRAVVFVAEVPDKLAMFTLDAIVAVPETSPMFTADPVVVGASIMLTVSPAPAPIFSVPVVAARI